MRNHVFQPVLVVILLAVGLPSLTDAFSVTTQQQRHRQRWCAADRKMMQQHKLATAFRIIDNRKYNSDDNKLVLKGFLDGLFGGDDKVEIEKKDWTVLEIYEIPNTGKDEIDVRFESLSDYITKKWIDLFDAGTISLTTPIKVSKTFDSGNNDAEEPVAVEEATGCRLVFQKIDTGYQNKSEEDITKNNGNNDIDNSSKKKKNEIKQGGVEIVVQKYSSLSSSSSTDEKSRLRVIARRCEIDEDTMIKEMSEEIILKELAKAIDVWRKELASEKA